MPASSTIREKVPQTLLRPRLGDGLSSFANNFAFMLAAYYLKSVTTFELSNDEHWFNINNYDKILGPS